MKSTTKRLIGDILVTMIVVGVAVLIIHWFAGCAAQSGGIREDAIARIDAVGASVHQVRNDVVAARDAVTRTVSTHGVSGWTLFVAFATYWLVKVGGRTVRDYWRRVRR